jgi:hypothetical protein
MILLIMYVVLFKLYYMGHRPWWLWPAAIVFLIIDVLLNATVMWVLMLEPPGEWTITERMKDYKKLDPSKGKLRWWRYHFADNMCLILNVFDKSDNGHC